MIENLLFRFILSSLVKIVKQMPEHLQILHERSFNEVESIPFE